MESDTLCWWHTVDLTNISYPEVAVTFLPYWMVVYPHEMEEGSPLCYVAAAPLNLPVANTLSGLCDPPNITHGIAKPRHSIAVRSKHRLHDWSCPFIDRFSMGVVYTRNIQMHLHLQCCINFHSLDLAWLSYRQLEVLRVGSCHLHSGFPSRFWQWTLLLRMW